MVNISEMISSIWSCKWSERLEQTFHVTQSHIGMSRQLFTLYLFTSSALQLECSASQWKEWEDGCDLSDNVIAPPLLLVRKCTRGTQRVIECICWTAVIWQCERKVNKNLQEGTLGKVTWSNLCSSYSTVTSCPASGLLRHTKTSNIFKWN